MTAIKWDYEKHAYQPYQTPEGAVAWAADLQSVVSCAECGEGVIAGDTYASQMIHVPLIGIAFLVCERCHEREMRERLMTEQENEERMAAKR